jgi:hypothetical protein
VRPLTVVYANPVLDQEFGLARPKCLTGAQNGVNFWRMTFYLGNINFQGLKFQTSKIHLKVDFLSLNIYKLD